MNSLKRQAAKAERYAAVRDELRGRLRVVLASRLHQMDTGKARWLERMRSRGSPRRSIAVGSAGGIARQRTRRRRRPRL